MKKFLTLLICLVFSCSVASAAGTNQKNASGPRIALVLIGNQNLFTEKRITEEIMKNVELKFPSNKYNVIEDKKLYQALLIAVEERNDTDIVAIDQLKQQDFVNAGAKYGYDYVMVLPFYNMGGYYTTSGWTNMVSQNITLKARIVDVKQGEYLYRLDVTEQGETGNSFGSPSLIRAQREGVKKCLENVFTDLEIGEPVKKAENSRKASKE